MSDEAGAATHASNENDVLTGGSEQVDPATWGITKKPTATAVGARVPKPVAESWSAMVAKVAKQYGISKGNAAACGFLIALKHKDEWVALAQQVRADGENVDADAADPG